MRKKIYFVLLLLMLLFLPSCGKKDYGLVELSGTEFINTFFAEDVDFSDISVVFAIYSSTNKDTDKFLEDLEKVANKTKEYIYYMDYDHVSVFDSLYLEDYFSGNNTYTVIVRGKVIVNNTYSDYETLYKDLNGKKYKNDIKFNSEEYIDEQLKIAQEEYDAGRISSACGALFSIWNSKKAKEFYNSHDYFKLFHYWEGYFNTEKTNYIHYFSLDFGNYFNSVTVIDEKDTVENFEKPEDGEFYFYYIKDNYFYISESPDDGYKKSFKIISLNDKNLVVEVNKKEVELYYYE